MKVTLSNEEKCIMENYASIMLNNPCRKCSAGKGGGCCGCPELYKFEKDNSEVIKKYNLIGEASFNPGIREFKDSVVAAFMEAAENRKLFDDAKNKLDKSENRLKSLLDGHVS